MRFNGIIAAAVAVLSTPAIAQTTIDGSDARLGELTTSLFAMIRASDLRDPLSAQLRGLFHNEALSLVCGEVNAKNAMGAYVGFVPFMLIMAPEGYSLFVADEPEEEFWISEACLIGLE